MFPDALSNVSNCRRRAFAFAFTLLFLLFSLIPAVRAAPGDLDPTFGNGGKLLLPVANENSPRSLYDAAIQPDGKIVAVGALQTGDIFSPIYRAALVRLNANGTFDAGFGNNGKILPAVENRIVESCESALQADGKIVLACNTYIYNQQPASDNMTVFRYNADGTPDASFGTSGYVQTAISNIGLFIGDVVVQPDGKIIAGTYAHVSTNNSDAMVLVRYNANGSLDNSFDGDGIVYTPTPANRDDFLASILLKPDGKIVVTGKSDTPDAFVLFGFNADGTPDASFGTAGAVVTHIVDAPHYAGTAALQTDGKIVLLGIFGMSTINERNVLIRYNPNGTLDASFGAGGIVTTPFGQYDRFGSLAIDSVGKILTAGYRRNSSFSSLNVLVARFNSNGTPDTSFGFGGMVVTGDFGAPGSNQALSIALQPDRKIVVTGVNRHDKYSLNPVLVRYLNSGVREFDFDGDRKADVSIFRPNSSAEWYWSNSSNNQSSGTQFGNGSDKPVPSDYDGDGKTDIAVFRDGNWYRVNSSDNQFVAAQFGQAGDVPVPSDFDGDAKADLAVYRAGNWYILNSLDNSFRAEQFGISSDKPVIGDFDGDGKSDLAVYRAAEGVWYVQRSREGFFGAQFGINTDKPVAADYDGDGKTDLAVYRPADGTWYLLRSHLGFTATQFGIGTDKLVPADYDGDNKTDLAVYRDGDWYILRSQQGFIATQFGTADDSPIPSAFVP